MSPILLVIPDRRLYPLAARSLSVALLHPIHLRQQQTCHSISNFKINTNTLLLQWLPHSIIRFLPLIIQGTVHHFYSLFQGTQWGEVQHKTLRKVLILMIDYVPKYLCHRIYKKSFLRFPHSVRHIMAITWHFA